MVLTGGRQCQENEAAALKWATEIAATIWPMVDRARGWNRHAAIARALPVISELLRSEGARARRDALEELLAVIEDTDCSEHQDSYCPCVTELVTAIQALEKPEHCELVCETCHGEGEGCRCDCHDRRRGEQPPSVEPCE